MPAPPRSAGHMIAGCAAASSCAALPCLIRPHQTKSRTLSLTPDASAQGQFSPAADSGRPTSPRGRGCSREACGHCLDEHVLGRRLVHTEAEFWVFELLDGRHAAIFGSGYPGKEHFAAGPVVGFAVRFRRPIGDPGNEKPSTRWVQGRPAAGNRLPERVSGFKWHLRGTGDLVAPQRSSSSPRPT